MVQVLSNNDDDYNNSNNNSTANNILIIRLSPLLSPTPVLPVSSTSCASFASENPNEQTRCVLSVIPLHVPVLLLLYSNAQFELKV